MALDGGTGNSGVARDFSLVHQAAETVAGSAHEAPEVHEVADCREHLKVAFQIGTNIAVKPEGPSFLVG